MRCQNCQTTVPDNAKVCGECGTKLDKNAMLPCPSCGEDVPVTAKVCGFCGTRLEEKSAPLPRQEKKAEKPKAVQATVKNEAKKAEEAGPKVVERKTTARTKAEKNDKPTQKTKPAVKEKKKVPIWVYGVAAILVAVGAYFIFFRYKPGVDCLYGNWGGQVYLDGENIFNIQFVIGGPCENNAYCGTFSIPVFDVTGRIKIIEQRGSKFYFFAEPNAGKPASEIPVEYLQCNRDGTLFFESSQEGGAVVVSATLWPK